MIKIVWNWLMWKLYQGKANQLLAMNRELVQGMDARQKLDYAINGAVLGARIWTNPTSSLIAPQVLVLDVKGFIVCPGNAVAKVINHKSEIFQAIARGKLPKGFRKDYLTPTNMELAYAFWSLTRMLAIVYPGYGFERVKDRKGRCSDSEALTRIASSIVSSVATAHGHERGVREHIKVYRAMIDHGKGLLRGWPIGYGRE